MEKSAAVRSSQRSPFVGRFSFKIACLVEERNMSKPSISVNSVKRAAGFPENYS